MDIFRCGHGRSESNTYVVPHSGARICRICRAAYEKNYRAGRKQKDYERQRKRRIHEMIAATRLKLEHLLREAERYGIEV